MQLYLLLVGGRDRKNKIKTVLLASDHAGFKLKNKIKLFLIKKGNTVLDLGTKNTNSVDYPDYAHAVAKKVKSSKNFRGILVCGSGMGMVMAANRHKKIRAAQCYNEKSTKLSRLHNDANIITLGSRLLSKKNALNCVGIFLKTKFEGGRHLRRIKKI